MEPTTDAEAKTSAMVVRDSQAVRFAGPLSGDPEEVVEKATAIATRLSSIVTKANLAVTIGSNRYVKCEGWTTMLAMMGIFPRTDWTRRIEDGWEARVTFVHLASGREVCSGEAMCLPTEDRWEEAEQHAIRSMAETRATGKAARLGFSWIMTLAGYAATPLEEMPSRGSASDSRKWRAATEDETKQYRYTKKDALPESVRKVATGAKEKGKDGKEWPVFRIEVVDDGTPAVTEAAKAASLDQARQDDANWADVVPIPEDSKPAVAPAARPAPTAPSNGGYRANLHAGDCNACGQRVEKSAGYIEKVADKWVVRHHAKDCRNVPAETAAAR